MRRVMTLDHIVVRTPQRRSLLNDLATRYGFQPLDGFKIGGALQSEGVRFRNGPFIDVFDWPLTKAAFSPLLAIEGDIATVQRIAGTNGWAAKLHKRNEIAAEHRPPWSTLSFARGQGLISSLFIIEYEKARTAWQSEQYNGALYDRSRPTSGNADLNKIEIHCSDIATAQSQLDLIAGGSMPLIDLQTTHLNPEGVGALCIQQSASGEARWLHSEFH